ncbi:MAG: beta-propeller domain-containing protein, partial [Myxococcota bacterium]
MTHSLGPTSKLIPIPILLATGVGFTACDPQSAQDLPVVQTEASLRPIQTCAELETFLEDTAVQEMRVDLEAWNRGGFWFDVPEAGGDLAAGAPNAGRDDSAPSDFTTTNTQVEGVDEADFMKNDGTRILVLSGRSLYLVRSWPPQDLAVSERLELDGWPLEMFLDEDGRAIVFSSWWPEIDAQGDVACGPWGCGVSRSFTRVTVIDTTDDLLSVERETFLPGSYVSSRRIGSSVRVVLRENLGRPSGLRYWPENFQGDPSTDRDAFEAAMAELKAENERLIRAQSLSDWIPQAFMRVGGTDRNLDRPCTSFHRPTASSRLGLTTVATLDLGQTTPSLNQISVLGEVGEIYASAESLYLASPHWWWWPEEGQTTHTYIHKLDIRDPSRARYAGSGGVPGYLHNQFSMDEHLGFLRIATTAETWRTEATTG